MTNVYDIARPVAIQWRDGHSWTLAYGSANQLTSVADAFGNKILFSWLLSSGAGGMPIVPQAIQSAALPGGYGVSYTYATVGQPTGVVPYPDILTQVQWLDSTGTIKDQTTYQYANANCPYNVTAVLDYTQPTNVQRWGVTYDNTSCMATVSSVTGAIGGVNSYEVAYPSEPPPAGGAFSRQVTNPLGTISIYSYTNNTAANQGLQLLEVDENTGSTPTTGLCTSGTPTPGETFRCYTYGSVDGFVASLTDENGNVTQYESTSFPRDPRGMPTEIIEALTSTTTMPRTTNIVWDSLWHEPDSVTVCAGTSCTSPSSMLSTTTFQYTGFGAVKTKTVTDETTFTVPYSTNGRTRTWTWGWPMDQVLELVRGPRWVSGGTIEQTSFTYNANKYLGSITDPLGHVTHINTVDWRGAPTKTTDPNGVVTTFQYDVHGRLTQAVVNSGGTAPSEYQFAYDPVGDLQEVTLPAVTPPSGGTATSATLQYLYDQGQRLMKVTKTNTAGSVTRAFTYDNNSDPKTLTTANSAGTTTQSHSANYDEWGRLLTSVGASGQTWTLGYDNLSNLTSVTDPVVGSGPANVRTNTFDALNRVIKQTDPESHTVQYAYDSADNLNQLTDARSLQTKRVVDGFGEVIQETSPDRNGGSTPLPTVYWYDVGGNLIKTTNGNATHNLTGFETDFVYDNADRLMTTTYQGDPMGMPSVPAETVGYAYDTSPTGDFGIGRLYQVTDPTGSETFLYDAQGRIVSDAKAVNINTCTPTPQCYTTTYAYDANGKVIGIGYPNGDAQTVTRDTDGLITEIQYMPNGKPIQTVVSGVTFEPFGPLASAAYGNGLGLTRGYNLDYQLTGVETAPTSGAAAVNVTYGWQTDGRIASVADQLVPTMGPTSRTSTFAYTPSGRVMTGDGPWGNNGYVYDASGNLTQNGAVTMTVSPTSNQVTATSGAVVRALTYRAGGELTGDSQTSGLAMLYTYDASDRMVAASANGTTVGQYGYDFAGRRVSWIAGGSIPQVADTYDLQGRLQTEANAATGALYREYIWLDDQLIGMAIPGATTVVRYVTTGQIDEPLIMTAANKSLSWNDYLDPFGVAGSISGSASELNLRYPGQWYQSESSNAGLNQNGWREYDPTLGRYTQPDPVGVDAGPNTYAYINGDPLNDIDPDGLRPLDPYEKQALAPDIPAEDLNAADIEFVPSLPWYVGKSTTSYTVGNTIYVRSDVPVCGYSYLALIGHELVHVGQYRKLGTEMFLQLYWTYSIEYGYWSNPLEVQAYQVQAQIMSRLSGGGR